MLQLLPLALLAASAAVAQDEDAYAPTNVSCPSTSGSLLRLSGSASENNQTLGSDEQSWVSERRSQMESSWSDFLSNHSIGYSADDFNSSTWPTLGLAVSGGGFRAALYGAGVFNALDGRNSTSAEAGLGGFLQVSTYATGLSGGSWFLGSWAIHGAPSAAQLVLGSENDDSLGWLLQNGLLIPDGILGFFGDNQDYYDALEADVQSKREAGFNVSVTDIWARALSYHFAPGTTLDNFYDSDPAHGAGILWSDITNTSAFQSHSMPFPIVVADIYEELEERPASTTVISLANTVFEFSPFEFGSYDPMLQAFVPMKLVGTEMKSGTPVDQNQCVNDFEQFSFIIGTSSSLFNAILGNNPTADAGSDFTEVVKFLLDAVDLTENDLYALYPNPFQGVSSDTFAASVERELNLVDGGENGENVPLNPLLASARGVDVIFAIDSSADTDDYWPNGTALLRSRDRSQLDGLEGAYALPPIPADAEAFVSGGYNSRPTFFGCQSNSSSKAPLLVYMPNAPSGDDSDYDTNTSTFKLQYDVDEAAAFINTVQTNTFRGKADAGSKDDQFPACLACAVMDRARESAGLDRSSQCEDCFKDYCYDESSSQKASTQDEDGDSSSASALSHMTVGAFVVLAGVAFVLV